ASLASHPGIYESTLQSASGRPAMLSHPRSSWRSKHNTSAAHSAHIRRETRRDAGWIGLLSRMLVSETIPVSILGGQSASTLADARAQPVDRVGRPVLSHSLTAS